MLMSSMLLSVIHTRGLQAALAVAAICVTSSCAHKATTHSFEVKANERSAMRAAACALRQAGYDHDLEVMDEIASVTGKRFADFGATLDAETIRATIEVVTENGYSDIYIVYKPGPAVATTRSEVAHKIQDIEDAYNRCLRR